MYDDLVKRLRTAAETWGPGLIGDRHNEAADAIERLSARIAELESGQPVEHRGEMWQLVRVDPSEKMCDDGYAHVYSPTTINDMPHVWYAMLTASAQEAKT